MISDRPQKKLAAKFCAAQGITPFLEVVVRSHTGLEDIPLNITDVDVLGLDLGRFGVVQRLLFDCKSSGSKLSPINRSLWAGGLKAFVKADRAYVILKKEAPYSHRLAANDLDVHIHSEETFVKYANSLSIDFSKDITYLDNLDIWGSFIGLAKTQPAISELLAFVNTQTPLERSGPKGIRLGLSRLIKSEPELDPKKPLHRLMFGNFVSAFLIFLSLSATALKDIFHFSMEKEQFARTIRYFVWEGRENYEIRRDMKSAIDRARGRVSRDFDLPEWDRFLHIMRLFLDAPEAIASLPFLTKEIAFRAMAGARNDPDDHLRSLFAANNRARQFVFGTAAYLVHAAKLPREFSNLLETDINSLVTPSSGSSADTVDSE